MTKLMMAAMLLAAQPVFATTITEIRVPIADLDLNKKDGVSTLDQRLNRAANRVCGFSAGMTLPERRSALSCRRDALVRARPARDAAIARAGMGNEQIAAR